MTGAYLFSERKKYDNKTPPQTPPVRRLSLRLISRHRLAVKPSLTATAPGSSPAIAGASRLVCQPDLVEPAATPDFRRPADPPKPSGVSRRRGNPVCALWDTTKSCRTASSVGPMDGSNQDGAGLVRWIDGKVKPGWRRASSVGTDGRVGRPAPWLWPVVGRSDPLRVPRI